MAVLKKRLYQLCLKNSTLQMIFWMYYKNALHQEIYPLVTGTPMNRSGIITLLTDFGLSDAYVAMMKGVILSINRDAELIDITHSIRTGSVFQGAYILKESFPVFLQALSM
jgi:hypothetical protein